MTTLFKTMTLFALLIGLGYTSKAQEGVRSLLNLDFGLRNGLSYDLALGKRFTTRLHVGATLALNYTFNGSEKGFNYGGIVPNIGVEPRWYYSAVKNSGTNNNGGYIALGIWGLWNRQTLLAKEPISDILQYTVRLVPGWGYTKDINERFSFRFFSGLDINWYINKYGSQYIVERRTTELPLHIDLGLSYRL